MQLKDHLLSSVSGPRLLPQRRRFTLVYPKFQLPLLAVNLGVTVLVSGIVWIQTRRALLDLEPSAQLSGMEVEFFKNYLDYQVGQFQTSLLIALLVGIFFSALVTLWLSHRFAGPIIRLRSYFHSLGEGSGPIREIGFRDGDYLCDLAPIINRGIHRVELRSAYRKTDRPRVG